MWHQWRIKKQNKSSVFVALILSVFAVVSGCSEKPTTPAPKAISAPVAAIKPSVVSTPTPTSNVQETNVYTYRSQGRRDPFAPIISKLEKPQNIENLPPLQRYNISEFKLSGIIWGGFGYNAILDGPDGKGYFVRVGTIIGPNRGRIKKITQHSMTIEEKYKNVMGEMERKEITVELRKKQEEKP